MNSSNTNVGGWYASEMRTYVNSDIYNLLPNDLKSVIIPTAPIISGSGVNKVSNNVVASGAFKGDKLYLLSGKEVGIASEYDNKKEDTDTKTLKYYEYYKNKDARWKFSVTTSTGKVSIDSKMKYWLRTAYPRNDTDFWCVDSNNDGLGITEIASNMGNVISNYGVAPAFRILN